MSVSGMEISSGDESTRTPTPQTDAVPMDLYREQVALNRSLQEELAKLNTTIAELRRELQEMSKPAPQKGKRKKPKILSSSSASSSDEEERPRTPATTQRPRQAPQPPMQQRPSHPTQAPETTRQETPGTSTMDTTPAPQEAPATPTGTEAPAKTTKIPPVILRKKERWTAVSRMLSTRGIQYQKAKLINDGIAITAATIPDFRKMTAIFNTTGEEYHTYTLAEDRQLRAVIRGLPTGIPNQEIQADLREQGFPEAKVQRMTSRRTGKLMPLVLVQVPQDQTTVLEVKRCCSLVVRVERQRIQQQATQCHRCQRFGHGQSRCTATPKCVKCGQEHATEACQKSREEPAKCANCGGDHPASYRGCPRFPKPKKTPAATKKPVAEKPQMESRATSAPLTQTSRPTTSGVSYAQAAAGKKTAKKQTPPPSGGTHPETMERVIAQFQQQMQQQMLEMFKTMISKMPSLFQA